MALPLPSPAKKGTLSVEEALSQRRSRRRFKGELLTMFQLSQLLWSAQGLSRGRFRTVPSAGATYPLEVLIVSGRGGVEGLEAGIYRYDVPHHALGLLRLGDYRDRLCQVAGGQRFILQAPVSLVIAAIYRRTTDWYGWRGERYVHMEVGHAGQNVHLEAEALGLATVMVGAFEDEAVRKLLGVEDELQPLYIMPVGRPG